jgi:hypothetical protein
MCFESERIAVKHNHAVSSAIGRFTGDAIPPMALNFGRVIMLGRQNPCQLLTLGLRMMYALLVGGGITCLYTG